VTGRDPLRPVADKRLDALTRKYYNMGKDGVLAKEEDLRRPGQVFFNNRGEKR